MVPPTARRTPFLPPEGLAPGVHVALSAAQTSFSSLPCEVPRMDVANEEKEEFWIVDATGWPSLAEAAPRDASLCKLPEISAPLDSGTKNTVRRAGGVSREPISSSLSPELKDTLDVLDDGHVTVWFPETGQTLAGNAAPNLDNLEKWIQKHPGWEKKAQELKSPKRQSAARRAQSAREAFASLCMHSVAESKFFHACREIVGEGRIVNSIWLEKEACILSARWMPEDHARLHKALFSDGQKVHLAGGGLEQVPQNMWQSCATAIGKGNDRAIVVIASAYALLCGVREGITMVQKVSAQAAAKAKEEEADWRQFTSSIPMNMMGGGRGGGRGGGGGGLGATLPNATKEGSFFSETTTAGCAARGPPGGLSHEASSIIGMTTAFSGAGSSSLPNLDSASSFLGRSIRKPREPKVTVWNPATKHTVSGNAAPSRSRLDPWLAKHPGWVEKVEKQLSASWRTRKTVLSAVTSAAQPSSAGTNAAVLAEPFSVHVAAGFVPTPLHAGSRLPASPITAVTQVEPEALKSPSSLIVNEALEGLLLLSTSPCESVILETGENAAVSVAPPAIMPSVSSGPIRFTDKDVMQVPEKNVSGVSSADDADNDVGILAKGHSLQDGDTMEH